MVYVFLLRRCNICTHSYFFKNYTEKKSTKIINKAWTERKKHANRRMLIKTVRASSSLLWKSPKERLPRSRVSSAPSLFLALFLDHNQRIPPSPALDVPRSFRLNICYSGHEHTKPFVSRSRTPASLV